MPRVVSIQRQAIALDRDRARVEADAVRAAIRVGNAVRRGVFEAYRRGLDPAEVIRRQMRPMADVLIGTLMHAHARGHLIQMQRTAQHLKGRKIYAARTPLDGAIDFLRRRIEASDQQINALADLYSGEVLKVQGEFTRTVERRILSEVRKLIIEGASVRQGVRRLGRTFDRLGMEPDNAFHLESIVRSETAKAYAAGRWNALRLNPIAWDALWGFRYATVGDTRVRPTHAVMQGVTLPKDDPWWRTNFPPNGWGCRCQAVELFRPPSSTVQPRPVVIDGETIEPVPDKGWGVNPGEVFVETVPLGPDPAPALPTPAPALPAPVLPAPAVAPSPAPETLRVPDVIEFKPDHPLKVEIEEALDALDGVHELPTSHPQIVVSDDVTLAPNAEGYLQPRVLGEPPTIVINPASKLPQIATVHEVGHFVDRDLLGRYGLPGSMSPDSPAVRVMRAIETSRARVELADLRISRAGNARVQEALDYLERPKELFARAYSQFIAQRSTSRILKAELESLHESLGREAFWTAEDFQSIADEFEQMMVALGWIKQAQPGPI